MSNVLGKRKFAIVIATVLSVALLGAASLASADPSCPSIFSECVVTDGFDTDLDGWENVDNSELTWLSSKTFLLGNDDVFYGQGVLQAQSRTANSFSFGKNMYMEPGAYRLQFRFTAEFQLVPSLVGYYVVNIVNFTTGEIVDTFDSSTGNNFFTGAGGAGNIYFGDFQTLTTDEMNIPSSGMYRVVVNVTDIVYPFYLDTMIIGKVNSNLTPGAPTYTPIPTGQPQATPQATPIGITCNDSDDSDLVPSNQRFAYFYDSGAVQGVDRSRYWSRNSPLVTDGSIDFSGSGRLSVQIPNSVNTTTIDSRPAWVFSPTTQIANTYYIYGHAMAISLPVGNTQYIQVYAKDSGVWEYVGEMSVSGWYWYEFTFTDTTPSAVTQIAFTARRNDDLSEGGVYVDTMYVYGHEYLKPRCDGQWWSMQDGALTLLGSSSPGSTTIMIPSDRECPPNIDEANNFWGPLISSLTLFTDQLFALAPAHIPGNMRIIGQNLIESPIPAFVRLFSVLFDLRVPMTLIGIGLAMESARVIIVVFQMLKKTIPFL